MLKKDIETFQSAIKLKDEKNKEMEKEIKEKKLLIIEKKEKKLQIDNLEPLYLAPVLETKELMLPKTEEMVYKQLTREIEEFRQWIKSKSDKLKPTRELILNEIKQAIIKTYPKFDVIYFILIK